MDSPLPRIDTAAPTLFRPGRNCWRVAHASRAAVLTNGNYFRVLAGCLAAAERQVVLLGWDLDARLILHPKAEGPARLPIHGFLRHLLMQRPGLAIRCLVWKRPFFYGGNRNARRWLERLRRDFPNFDYRFVAAPFAACHHHKLVAIDDRIAFAGGIDLCAARWDRREHRAVDPARLTPDGEPYGPVRDIQMMVDGDAAGALGALARACWTGAAGQAISAPTKTDGPPWPASVVPDFTDIPVAIARTEPNDGVREVEALTRDALLAARRAIYIEAQYLTATMVGDILEQRLNEPDGPEIVVIVTRRSSGYVEQLAMATNRDRLLRRLTEADLYDRLRVYYPCASDATGTAEMKIHSKLIIADDCFLRVGSSNLNNRSMGVDTECDLALEGLDASSRRQILAIRARLIAELLQRPRAEVASASGDRGLIATIEALNQPRRLCAFPAIDAPGPTLPLIATPVLDPDAPLTGPRLWQAVRQAFGGAASLAPRAR